MNREISVYAQGVHNLLDSEIIPKEAAQDENNWYNIDGRLTLVPGKELIGISPDQSQTTQNGTIVVGEADATTRKIKIAQSFIPTGTRISAVSLYKSADTGSFTGTVLIEIKTDVAGVPTTTVATKTLTNAEWLALSTGLNRITFDTEYTTLTVGGTYWIVITPSTNDNANCINLGTNTSGGYTSGSVKYFNTTDSWTAVPTIDLYFQTWQTVGPAGSITGEIFGYKADGSKVHFRKEGSKIQYFDGTAWQNIITGLTETADYSFANYSSLAGTFTYVCGEDGIYKIHTANPESYTSMYDPAVNFKGRAIIDKGRMLMWNLENDKTALRGSSIDAATQVAVSNETIGTGDGTTTVFTGTLAFKAGNAKSTCYDIAITTNPSGVTAQDNNLGAFIASGGTAGPTGTINYTTGAFSLTFPTAPASGTLIYATYVHENTNSGGITDFTYSATRLAGEGFRVPQDEGGDPILNVLIGVNGYYSLKSQSTYLFTIDTTDLVISNEVFRKEIGLTSWRAAISTSKGIIFMNTASPEKPEVTILQKNTVGDAVEPFPLFKHFKFANYNYDDCTFDAYDRYIVIACRTVNATANDTILLCDQLNNTVDITSYNARTFARSDGFLYAGSSISKNVYKIYNGYDDDGFYISNFWTGKTETWGTNELKKYRKIRFKGRISREQSYEVYINYDNRGFQLVGTVLGTGSYVDISSPQTIGANLVGSEPVGGGNLIDVYPYYVELRLKKVPKFRSRTIKIVALGIGYIDIDSQMDMFIDTYEQKMPAQYRQKQNVTLDGATTNSNSPDY